MISEYAASLAGKLSFDRSLSRCVREEVEVHLWEAVAADAASDPLEAQRRAIANFGDPQRIAAQFAVAWLAAQTRKAGTTVILVIAGVFLAMTIRVAWYELTHWGVCESMEALRDAVGFLDRSAFFLAVAGGIGGWAFRNQTRHFCVACGLAAGALIVSVACDAFLTTLRLSGWEFSVDFLIPILSMAIEIACAALLVAHLRGLARRAASTAVLATQQ